MRFIDLSVPMTNRCRDASSRFPEGVPIIEYVDHKGGQKSMTKLFGIEPEKLPVPGDGWAVENIQLTTHTGTHLDAPYHFGALSNGMPAKTIDQIPLDWCYGDGVVLDMRHIRGGQKIQPSDLEKELERIGYTLKPFDIVLIRCDGDKDFATDQYVPNRAGMSKEATLWLIERGIKITGIDNVGWDVDFPNIAKIYKDTGDPKTVWEGHFAGMIREYCHIEKLANLYMLPPFGFKIVCFPISIEGASAGWVRPVAILGD